MACGPIPQLKTGTRLLGHVRLHETLTAKAHPAARPSSAERPTAPSREISSVYRSWEPEVQSLPTLRMEAAQPAGSPLLSVVFETTCVLSVLLRLTEALSGSALAVSVSLHYLGRARALHP